MKTGILFFLFSLLFNNTFFAQTVVQGTIKNEQQEPLVGAVIACISNADNKLQRGATTDINGKFKIEVNTDEEWIRISYLGYTNQDFTHPTEMPGEIIMKPANVELAEVVVQGKSIVTQKSDRLIFSIANSNIVKGNNTMQLLRFTPLMRMENDQISMLGKSNMQLYINGKKSNISGDAMQSYFRNLPAEKVERIELITDPGSEYRVESNEGVLNIVLKKDEKQGWKGTLSLYDQLGYYNCFGGGLYLDYQKKDFAISLSASETYYYENKQASFLHEYIDENRSNHIDRTNRWDYRLTDINLNMDYKLADNHRIGAMADISYNRIYDYTDSQTNYNRLFSASADSSTYSQNRNNSKGFLLTTNINYRWDTDDRGSGLAFDVDYVRSYKEEEQPMTYFHKPKQTEDKFTQNTDVSNYSYSAKLEYLHACNSGDQLKIGSESYYTKNEQDFFYGNFMNGKYESDAQKTNLFELKENYLAAYTTYNRKWSTKVMSILGVRGEYLKREGISRNSNQEVKNNDFSILPSVSLTYNVNENHQLSYSLTSRMNYPYYALLSPFRYYVSPTVYTENNSNIENRQIFIHSLRYILKQHYIFSVSYISSKGNAEIFTPVEGGYTRISTRTFGHSHLLQGILNWNDSFWNNRLYLNASFFGWFNRSYGHLEEYKIDVSNFSYNTSLNWNLLLSKRYNWNLDGYVAYYSKSVGVSSMSSDGRFYVNLALRKKFKNDISLKLGCRCPLYNTTSLSLKTENYNLYQSYANHSRKLTLDITIPFGRKKVSGASYKTGASSLVKGQITN